MPNPLRFRETDDWAIQRDEVLSLSAFVGGGVDMYHFKSDRLRYGVVFYVPKLSAGWQIGANVSGALDAALSALNSQIPGSMRGGNDHWRVLRPFSGNDLVGATVRMGMVGADVLVFSGSGMTLKIVDNNDRDIVAYDGGSAGVGLGASVNIGSAGLGAFFGPYSET